MSYKLRVHPATFWAAACLKACHLLIRLASLCCRSVTTATRSRPPCGAVLMASHTAMPAVCAGHVLWWDAERPHHVAAAATLRHTTLPATSSPVASEAATTAAASHATIRRIRRPALRMAMQWQHEAAPARNWRLPQRGAPAGDGAATSEQRTDLQDPPRRVKHQANRTPASYGMLPWGNFGKLSGGGAPDLWVSRPVA
jgi:hypothetical protein